VSYLSSSNYTSIYVQEEPVIIKYPSVDVIISPDPVGVNQMAEIGITFSPSPPSDTEVFHDFRVYIRESGSIREFFGPLDSSSNGEYYLR
jgi:hypothetical protein